jgi:RND family efflux transporter MFP subunit
VVQQLSLPEKDLSRLRIDRGEKASAVVRAARGRRRWLWFALLVIAIATAGVAYSRMRAVREVEVATVTTAYPSQAIALLNATGYVVPQRKASLGSKATGRLEWLGVQEGSKITQGEVIARIENRDVNALLNQAQANVQLARANLEQGQAELRNAELELNRARDLVARNFLSRSAYDQALARHDRAKAVVSGYKAAIGVAEAARHNAEVVVEQTLIRAPFDGVVLTKNANVGDVITTFSAAVDTKGAVVTIADMSTLEVEADVSESNLQKAKVGQPVEIQLDALPDMRFRGEVARIVPTVDRAKATVLGKVRFIERDERVLPDMSAKVSFLSQEVSAQEQKPLLAVNPEALVQRDGRTVVLVVKDGAKAVETVVVAGIRIGDLVAVTGELRSGDKVVIKPPADLKTGTLTRPAAK